MNRLMSLIVAVGVALFAAAGMASTHSSAKDAEALLDRAVAKINQDGPEKAFEAFNNHNGGFVEGELYIFVFDMDGMYEASGFNPSLTGSRAQDLKDVNGKYVVQEMVNVAKNSGQGWIEYVWVNPANGKLENKHSLIRRVKDYIVGVGYYSDRPSK